MIVSSGRRDGRAPLRFCLPLQPSGSEPLELARPKARVSRSECEIVRNVSAASSAAAGAGFACRELRDRNRIAPSSSSPSSLSSSAAPAAAASKQRAATQVAGAQCGPGPSAAKSNRPYRSARAAVAHTARRHQAGRPAQFKQTGRRAAGGSGAPAPFPPSNWPRPPSDERSNYFITHDGRDLVSEPAAGHARRAARTIGQSCGRTPAVWPVAPPGSGFNWQQRHEAAAAPLRAGHANK
jgi:hypothetical protein